MPQEKTIVSMMGEKRVFKPPEEVKKKAYIKSLEEYREIYNRSINDPEGFWAEIAEQLEWYRKWDRASSKNGFSELDVDYFKGGKCKVPALLDDRFLMRSRAVNWWRARRMSGC